MSEDNKTDVCFNLNDVDKIVQALRNNPDYEKCKSNDSLTDEIICLINVNNS